MIRRVIISTVAFLVLVACSSHPRLAPVTQTAHPGDEPVAAAPESQDQAADTEDSNAARAAALTHTVNAHAQALSPQINRRTAAAETRPVEATIDPSVIKWLQNDYRFELTEPQANSHPAPAPLPEPPAQIAVAENDAKPLTLSQEQPPTTDELERRLAERIRTDSRDLAAHLDYQLIQLLRGRQVPQMQNISSLSIEDREILAALLDGLSNFRANAGSDRSAMLSRRVQPLLEMSQRLRAATVLSVPTLVLCRKVDGFGVYDPVDTDRLPAGQETALVMYCEVENFSSRRDAQGWVTELTEEAVLYNERGQRVWHEARQPIRDLSRNRRHDFFVARRVKLPVLPAGHYTLTVSIADQQSNRITEKSLNIRLVERER